MKNIKIILSAAFILMLSTFVDAQTMKPTKNIPIAEHYEGGQDSMYAFINRNIVYPILAKKNRMQGECIVGLTLEADGSTSGHTIVKNIGGGAAQEASRVIKQLKFKGPGYRIQTSIPVIFKL
jgi:protein TonB